MSAEPQILELELGTKLLILGRGAKKNRLIWSEMASFHESLRYYYLILDNKQFKQGPDLAVSWDSAV